MTRLVSPDQYNIVQHTKWVLNSKVKQRAYLVPHLNNFVKVKAHKSSSISSHSPWKSSKRFNGFSKNTMETQILRKPALTHPTWSMKSFYRISKYNLNSNLHTLKGSDNSTRPEQELALKPIDETANPHS